MYGDSNNLNETKTMFYLAKAYLVLTFYKFRVLKYVKRRVIFNFLWYLKLTLFRETLACF